MWGSKSMYKIQRGETVEKGHCGTETQAQDQSTHSHSHSVTARKSSNGENTTWFGLKGANLKP